MRRVITRVERRVARSWRRGRSRGRLDSFSGRGQRRKRGTSVLSLLVDVDGLGQNKEAQKEKEEE